MVNIRLDITYDLTRKEQRSSWVSLSEKEREIDLVQNCIIPAVTQYLSIVNQNEIPKHKPEKAKTV
jgi:hypothetical protein